MMGGFFWVAWAVAGRQIYKYFTNPAFLAPALFPLFFFVAFAGGLTRVGDVPGFDYAAGLHRLPVRLGALAGGRDGRGVHRVLDRGGLRERLRQKAHARRLEPVRDHPRLHHSLAGARHHDGDARHRYRAHRGVCP